MKIGMFYQIQVPKPWTAEGERDRYWEMVEQVELADEIGMSSVWLAEHHFRSEWSHSSAPDVSLAALSQRTSNLRLGIAVVVSPIHHPLHTAARIATLDILSRGRVDLGIGRSGYPYQMAAFGRDLKDASGIVEESLEIIPRAWTEDEFSYNGRHFQIPPREVHPKPVQKPHPPIWQACSQGETFQKAGQLGLGCLVEAGKGAGALEGPIRAYREATQSAKSVGKVAHNRVAAIVIAFCDESRKKAFDRGAELIDWYRNQQRLRNVRVWQEQDPSRVPDDYQWHYRRAAAGQSPPDETSSLDLIKGGGYCIGDPDDCIRYIEQFRAIGVDEIIPLFQIGPITHREVLNTLRLFDKHVIPHFNEKGR